MGTKINKKQFIIECYDIGGTNIRAALIINGKIKEPFLIERTDKRTRNSLINQIKSLSTILRKKHPKISPKQINATSMAVPGPVKHLKMLGSQPLEMKNTLDFGKSLKEFFESPLVVDNDLNVASQGELTFGKSEGIKNFCLLTISTGIGVGVIINGMLYNRNTELGHCIIEKKADCANPCLGHNGCWVAQASGEGIKKTAERMGERIDALMVFNNTKYQKLIERVKEYNAHGIGNIINAYDPEKIIIMGSLGLKQYDKIIPEPERIRNYTLLKVVPEIRRTDLGENIGLLGAYANAKIKIEI